MYSIIEVVDSTEGVAFDLTTVADVKTELAITVSTYDDEIQAQLSLYSGIIAEKCDRIFAQQHYIETFQLAWCEHPLALPLKQYPVQQVFSVEIDGVEISADNYRLDPATGLLHYFCGTWYGREITVSYVAGYDLPDDAPASLARACVEFVKDKRLAQGRDPSIREISDDGSSVGYWGGNMVNTDSLPPGVSDLIAPFRRLTV